MMMKIPVPEMKRKIKMLNLPRLRRRKAKVCITCQITFHWAQVAIFRYQKSIRPVKIE